MADQIVDFVDVFPTSALQTALSFVRGEAVTKRQVALAALNIESYALGMFIGEDGPVPMFATEAAACPSKEECEAALLAVMPDEGGTFAAGDQRGKWKDILTTILPLILKLLM